jgi:hypothetical protein
VNGQWQDHEGQTSEKLTIAHVRDSLVDCFTATHGPRFSESRAALGMETTPHAVRGTILGMVRLAFQQVGGSYDDPTPESLARAVSLLAERSLEWGVPEDVVFEHHCTMIRAVGRVLCDADH